MCDEECRFYRDDIEPNEDFHTICGGGHCTLCEEKNKDLCERFESKQLEGEEE